MTAHEAIELSCTYDECGVVTTGKRALADMLTRESAVYRRDLDEDTFNLYRIQGDELQSLAGEDRQDTWGPCSLILEHFLTMDDWVKVR